MFKVETDKVPDDYRKILSLIKRTDPEYKHPKHKHGERPLHPLLRKSKVLHKYRKRVVQLRADISEFNKIEKSYFNIRVSWPKRVWMKLMLQKNKLLKKIFGNFFSRMRYSYWTRRKPTHEFADEDRLDQTNLDLWTNKGMGYGMFKGGKLDKMSADLEKANRIWDDWFLEYRQVIKSENPMIRNPFEEADIERLKNMTRWIRSRDLLPPRQKEIIKSLANQKDKEKAVRKLESKYALRFVKDMFVLLKAQRDDLVRKLEKKARGIPYPEEAEKPYVQGDIKIRPFEKEFEEFDIGPDLAYQESELFSRELDVDEGHPHWRHTQMRNRNPPKTLGIHNQVIQEKDNDFAANKNIIEKNTKIPELKEKLKKKTPDEEARATTKLRRIIMEPHNQKSKEKVNKMLDEAWEKDLETPLNPAQAGFIMDKIREKKKFWDINKVPSKYKDWEKEYMVKMAQDDLKGGEDGGIPDPELRELVDLSIEEREKRMSTADRRARRTEFFKRLTQGTLEYKELDSFNLKKIKPRESIKPSEHSGTRADKMRAAVKNVNELRPTERRSIPDFSHLEPGDEGYELLEDIMRDRRMSERDATRKNKASLKERASTKQIKGVKSVRSGAGDDGEMSQPVQEKQVKFILPPIDEDGSDEGGGYQIEEEGGADWIMPPYRITGTGSEIEEIPRRRGRAPPPRKPSIQLKVVKPTPGRGYSMCGRLPPFTDQWRNSLREPEVIPRPVTPIPMSPRMEKLAAPREKRPCPCFIPDPIQLPSLTPRPPRPNTLTQRKASPRPRPPTPPVCPRYKLYEEELPKKIPSFIPIRQKWPKRRVSQAPPDNKAYEPEDPLQPRVISVRGKKLGRQAAEETYEEEEQPCVIFSERDLLDPRVMLKLEFEERNRQRMASKACEYELTECQHQELNCPNCYCGEY